MSEASSHLESRARLHADGVLVLITAFWGITFVVVKDALGKGDPFSFLALRFAIGASVLSLFAGRRMLSPSNLRQGAVLGAILFLSFALQTVGLTRTTPSRSAFITGMSVVFVPLLALVLFRRVPRVPSLLGVVFSAVGLYYLTRPDAGSATGVSSGDLFTLGCAVAFAFHILLTERYASKEGVNGLVAVQLWVVTGVSALCLPFVDTWVEWTPSFLGALVFCGVFASAMAISLQTWGQARTSAVRAAIIYSMEPVFASAYSVALGYEVLGPREWSGGGLILLGVLVSELGGAFWERWRAREALRA